MKKKKEIKGKKKRKRKRKYNSLTLLGIELSQVTPGCPHKSVKVIQTKLPFEVNELYQFTKIIWSLGSMSPIFSGLQ